MITLLEWMAVGNTKGHTICPWSWFRLDLNKGCLLAGLL